MMVQVKRGDDYTVIAPLSILEKGISLIRPMLDALPLSLYPKRIPGEFSTAAVPDSLGHKIKRINPNIVHLHWLGRGFVRIETLKKIQKPLVWTMHDMWPITGGCHIDQGCGRYEQQCGMCPQLGSSRKKDLSTRILQRKYRAWQDIDLTIVTPSHWLADCIKKSFLHNKTIRIIPNGLDIDIFKPLDRHYSRRLWQLPADKKIIVFGAMHASKDRNKGAHLLQKALHILKQNDDYNKIELLVFGENRPKSPLNFGLKTHDLGRLYDDVSLAAAYSAADIFVCPSLQENLPNTVAESLACGTPAVAFRTGGLPDMIRHQENGYLAAAFDPTDLAQGIKWLVDDDSRYNKLCAAARQKADMDYNIRKVTKQYESLYQEVATR